MVLVALLIDVLITLLKLGDVDAGVAMAAGEECGWASSNSICGRYPINITYAFLL